MEAKFLALTAQVEDLKKGGGNSNGYRGVPEVHLRFKNPENETKMKRNKLFLSR